MRQILQEVEQHLHSLEIRSDDPDVIHNQLEHCLVSEERERERNDSWGY